MSCGSDTRDLRAKMNHQSLDSLATQPSEEEYEVIIIGAGLAGLQCGHRLIRHHNVPANRILVLEAQDYVGGRVKQTTDFLPGIKIELGAEFVHGDNSLVNEFAHIHKQPLDELFCWAHGDGGPSEAPIGNQYGLYFIAGGDTKEDRLLRFDDKSADFKSLNRNLWDLTLLDDRTISESLSLRDYLQEFGTNEDMLALAAAGYANTMASNLEELSLKQCVRWAHEEHYDKVHSSGMGLCEKFTDMEGKTRSGSLSEKVGHSDYRFKNTYAVLVDHLKSGLPIYCNAPVDRICYRSCKDSDEGDVDSLVTCHLKDGRALSARQVVVTCSPHVLNSPSLLRFEPELPCAKQEALQCVSMYTAMKIILVFSSRIWPEGLDGMIMAGTLIPEVWFKEDSTKRQIPVASSDENETSDETRSSDSETSSYNDGDTVYIAVGFCSARFAENAKLLSDEELIATLLAQLNRVFCNFEVFMFSISFCIKICGFLNATSSVFSLCPFFQCVHIDEVTCIIDILLIMIEGGTFKCA